MSHLEGANKGKAEDTRRKGTLALFSLEGPEGMAFYSGSWPPIVISVADPKWALKTTHYATTLPNPRVFTLPCTSHIFSSVLEPPSLLHCQLTTLPWPIYEKVEREQNYLICRSPRLPKTHTLPSLL